MDERNGVGKAVRCNRPDTPCRHPSRVQKRSAEALRCGKAHQASQRLLCGGVCPANGRGNRFPYQHTQCRKGTQRPVGKAVLAKRQTSAIFLFVAKCFVNGFVERLFRSYITEHQCVIFTSQ
ncbi:hypothetical protein H6A36_05345 [Phocaeicola coprocola]|nr:hypothetical protein [Phocaeicola coprocola]